MEPRIEYSRQIAQAILRVLIIHAEAGLECGYAAADLAGLTRDSVWGTDPGSLASSIRDLIEKGLVRALPDVEPPRFVLTADGKDFFRAGCPWDQLYRFTGKQRP